jgi:peroxiredoxin
MKISRFERLRATPATSPALPAASPALPATAASSLLASALLALLAAAALATLAACSGHSSAGCAQDAATGKIGCPAPAFTEPTADGGTLALTSLKGKPVYLNFFATWCPPCNAEAPTINALQEKYAARGLHVVGVDVLENAAAARKFRDGHHLIYPALVDSGTLRDQYDVNGLPVHVFIDRTGVVKNIVVGELTPADMDENIRRILP